MNRREFVKTMAGSTIAISMPQVSMRPAVALGEDAYHQLDAGLFRKLADHALARAKKLGASYADIRVCRYENETLSTREDRVESIGNSKDSGFGVRVLINGTWGFASSHAIQEKQIERTTRFAAEMAKANHAA